jgi:hypothetical protein
MFQKTLDPKLSDRLQRYAGGMGPAKATATIVAWATRAELGDPNALRLDALTELVRAIALIAYVRSFYGVRQTEAGFEVDLITTTESDFAESLALQTEIAEALEFGPETEKALARATSEVASSVLGKLERAFNEAFGA